MLRAVLVFIRRYYPPQIRRARSISEQWSFSSNAPIASSAPPALRRRPLYQEHYPLAARMGHPAFARPVDLDAFCALDHLVVSPDGGGFVGLTDIALSAAGCHRNVVVSAASFPVVPELVRRSDLVAMAVASDDASHGFQRDDRLALPRPCNQFIVR